MRRGQSTWGDWKKGQPLLVTWIQTAWGTDLHCRRFDTGPEVVRIRWDGGMESDTSEVQGKALCPA